MADASALLAAIKRVAREADEAAQPADFRFGKVTSENPLQITIEQKIKLDPAQLVMCRNVTDYEAGYESETGDGETGTDGTSGADGSQTLTQALSLAQSLARTVTNGSNSDASKALIETLNLAQTLAAKVEAGAGSGSLSISNALKVGESVVLFKQRGGQKYLIIDRVVRT